MSLRQPPPARRGAVRHRGEPTVRPSPRAGRSHDMKRARHLSITPGAAIGLIALFFALGGLRVRRSGPGAGPGRRPAALRERCRPRRRRGHGHRQPGDREHSRQLHGRGQPLRPEVQLHRQGRPGATRRDGRLRGAVRRDLGRERRRERDGQTRYATVQAAAGGVFRVIVHPGGTRRPRRPPVHDRGRVATAAEATRTSPRARRTPGARPPLRRTAT